MGGCASMLYTGKRELTLFAAKKGHLKGTANVQVSCRH